MAISNPAAEFTKPVVPWQARVLNAGKRSGNNLILWVNNWKRKKQMLPFCGRNQATGYRKHPVIHLQFPGQVLHTLRMGVGEE